MKKKRTLNKFKIQFPAKSANEGFSRAVAGAICTQLDPTLEELCDIKTAVSEAVTNCIVHAYKNDTRDKEGLIKIEASYDEDKLLTIKIKDSGCGIDDINKALLPMYTTGGEDRSGMGFSIMQSFTDKLTVKSIPGRGTVVTLKKYIGKNTDEL